MGHTEYAWTAMLWGQLGAAIDALQNAIDACPDDVWSKPAEKPAWSPRGVVGFWYLAYHTLFFLDLQLSGGRTEGFSPPDPFDMRELDPSGLLPERAYAKTEIQSYLSHCREKCRATIGALTEEEARRPCRWGSLELTFAELVLYSMRHVQHHVGQLNLLLRQSTAGAPRYVRRASSTLGDVQ
jgi:DinB superfamily